MDRYIYNPVVGVGAALYAGYMAFSFLPSSVGGVPESLIAFPLTAVAILAAIHWL